jgi:hypothetical protein
MIGLILTVIVVSMVIGLFWWAVGELPFIPAPMAQIIRVVIIVGGCLWLLGMLFGHGGIGSLNLGAGIHNGDRRLN